MGSQEYLYLFIRCRELRLILLERVNNSEKYGSFLFRSFLTRIVGAKTLRTDYYISQSFLKGFQFFCVNVFLCHNLNLFKLLYIYHHKTEILVKDYNGIRNVISTSTIPIYNTSVSRLPVSVRASSIYFYSWSHNLNQIKNMVQSGITISLLPKSLIGVFCTLLVLHQFLQIFQQANKSTSAEHCLIKVNAIL